MQQIIADNSQLSGPTMPLDSRDKAETRRGCLVVPQRQEFATFYVASRLHVQFFVCDNFYLSHKRANKPAFQQTNLLHKNWPNCFDENRIRKSTWCASVIIDLQQHLINIIKYEAWHQVFPRNSR